MIAKCVKCGKEYGLREDENPGDFQCECGGKLSYETAPNPTSDESPKFSKGILETWNQQETSIKALSIVAVCFILLILILGATGMFNQGKTTTPTSPTLPTSNNSTTTNQNTQTNVQATWHSVINVTQLYTNTPVFPLKGTKSKVVYSAKSFDSDVTHNSLTIEVYPEGQSSVVGRGTIDNFKGSEQKSGEINMDNSPGNYYLKLTGFVDSCHVEVLDYY